jgi:ankyrin repeat protein
LNPNHDDIDIGPIDPDTQAKLAAILEATGITNSPIPEDFWRDQQVVRLLTSSVTNNLNGLHEIANVLSSSSSSSNQTDKKSKLINKDSGVLLRACVNNDIQTVEKILQRKNIKEYLNDINEDGDSILSLACSNGYTDLVELILRTIPDIAVNDRGNKQDCTPLMEGSFSL